MDTNNVEHEHIALSDPGELIAILPVTLGFHPADSLVVVSLDGADEPTVNLVIRADLPEPEQYDRLAARLAGSVVWQRRVRSYWSSSAGRTRCPTANC